MPKKNFRKIPDKILRKLKSIDDRYIVVGCLLTVSKQDIIDGLFKHLQISFSKKKGLIYPTSIIPNEKQGKYSDRNINGYVKKRDDLPKIRVYRTMEVPNYGDSWKGTHTVDIPQDVYPRDYYAPRLVNIQIECPDTSPENDKYIIRFQLDEILDKESNDFHENLLFLMNLLQENIYCCDVMPSTASFKDYLSTVQLAWEILPPGEKGPVIRKLIGRSKDPEKNRILEERYNFLMSIKPQNIIVGTSGLQRYLGALINDNLVIFENINYGNAIYIMYDNWEELSERSRIELLSGRFGDNFDRIIHSKGWKSIVRKIIKRKLKELG